MKMNKFLSLIVVLLTGLFLYGCGDDTDPEAGFDDGEELDESVELHITKAKHGPNVENIKFAITSPGPDEVVQGG